MFIVKLLKKKSPKSVVTGALVTTVSVGTACVSVTGTGGALVIVGAVCTVTRVTVVA